MSKEKIAIMLHNQGNTDVANLDITKCIHSNK